jgi:hypothetical protein
MVHTEAMYSGQGREISVGIVLYGQSYVRVRLLLEKPSETQKKGCGKQERGSTGSSVQGELRPLEEGMHALQSGRGLREYADRTSKLALHDSFSR